jgi:hypothetical protein
MCMKRVANDEYSWFLIEKNFKGWIVEHAKEKSVLLKQGNVLFWEILVDLFNEWKEVVMDLWSRKMVGFWGFKKINGKS